METKNIIAFMPEYVQNSTLDAMLILQIKGKIARGENVLVGMSFNRETMRIEVRDTETLTYLGSLFTLDAEVFGQCMSKGSCMGQIYLIEGSTIYIKAYILDHDDSDEKFDDEDIDESEYEYGLDFNHTISIDERIFDIENVQSFVDFVRNNVDENGNCDESIDGVIILKDDKLIFIDSDNDLEFELEASHEENNIRRFIKLIAYKTGMLTSWIELYACIDTIDLEEYLGYISMSIEIEDLSAQIMYNTHDENSTKNEQICNDVYNSSSTGEEELGIAFTGDKDTTVLLVGFQYHTSGSFFENIKIGDVFVLAKEPNNPVDSNAIAAYQNGRLRAYVQKDDSLLIRNLVDVPRECTVIQLNDKSVKVLIPKYDDLSEDELSDTTKCLKLDCSLQDYGECCVPEVKRIINKIYNSNLGEVTCVIRGEVGSEQEEHPIFAFEFRDESILFTIPMSRWDDREQNILKKRIQIEIEKSRHTHRDFFFIFGSLMVKSCREDYLDADIIINFDD